MCSLPSASAHEICSIPSPLMVSERGLRLTSRLGVSTSFCLVLASMHFGHWQLSLSCRGERAEGRLFGGAVAGWLLWGRGEVTRWYCGRMVAVGEERGQRGGLWWYCGRGERTEGRLFSGAVGGEGQRVKYSVVILAGKLLSKGREWQREGQPMVLWQNGWCGGREWAKGRLLGGALARYSAISFRFNGMFGGRGSASEE